MLTLIDKRTIADKCSDFLTTVPTSPLFKHLPSSYGDFKRVKLRKRRHQSEYTYIFNKAFEEKLNDIRQRGLFTFGRIPNERPVGYEPYYVFPVNGFRFIYNRAIANSHNEFHELVDKVKQNVDNAELLVTELLEFAYTDKNLQKGIDSGAEVIIFHSPCFYAVRRELIDYPSLTKELNTLIGIKNGQI